MKANQNQLGTKLSKPNKDKKGNHPPKNKILIKADIIIILEYSARKNKTKPTDEYSTL